MSSEKIPSYVRVQRVTTILADDSVLKGMLNGETQEIARRDGHKQKFPKEAIVVAQVIHADGKDVAHLGRQEILRYARDHFHVEAAPKEPTKSISDRNSESVKIGIFTLLKTAVEFEKRFVGGSQDKNAAALKRIGLLEEILKKVPTNGESLDLLPVYSMVMSAASLAEVDKTLSGTSGDFNTLRQLYREVVVI